MDKEDIDKEKINSREKLCFFYQCYKQINATEFVLLNVRKYFPNNIIYIVNDNGVNMKEIADKYNCVYIHCNENLCKNSNNLTNWNSETCIKWLNRILECVNYCNTEYLINLEDDVICYNKITEIPNGDINGVFDCPWAPNNFTNDFLKYLELKNIYPQFNYYGSCGGFIMKCEKFKTIMNNISIELLDDLNKYDNRIGVVSDCTITALFLINNFTYYPWNDLKSKWDERNIIKYAFYHPDKSMYI
jgi:hypothetical protein